MFFRTICVKALTAVSLTFALSAFAADPVAGSVTAKAVGNTFAPMVKVTFTFSDADGDACHVAFFGYDSASLKYYPMVHFMEGDIYGRTFTPGTYTVTWNALMDSEADSTALNTSSFQVYMRVSDTGRAAPGRYVVIDVSGGTQASSYPVEYRDYVDVALESYKTEKIVLRELPNGSYAGVYEVTQEQYALVTGQVPSFFWGNPMRPVEQVSWDDITGSGSYGGGFIATLRAKTGLANLGLPSSETWEYACRAGTTAGFNDFTEARGKGTDDEQALGKLGWYATNATSRTHDVGEKQPNAWGLYDMHGNVREWTSTASGANRVYRGGYWFYYASYCRSGYVSYNFTDYQYSYVGFRLEMPAG